VTLLGQKKVNKANDAFGLKKSREQNNQKNDTTFGNKPGNRPNNAALLNTFLQQVKDKANNSEKK
jgi:hypothetical protein